MWFTKHAARPWCKSDKAHKHSELWTSEGPRTPFHSVPDKCCIQLSTARPVKQATFIYISLNHMTASWQICTADLTLNPWTLDSNVETCNETWNTVVTLTKCVCWTKVYSSPTSEMNIFLWSCWMLHFGLLIITVFGAGGDKDNDRKNKTISWKRLHSWRELQTQDLERNPFNLTHCRPVQPLLILIIFHRIWLTQITARSLIY